MVTVMLLSMYVQNSQYTVTSSLPEMSGDTELNSYLHIFSILLHVHVYAANVVVLPLGVKRRPGACSQEQGLS